MNLTSQIPEDGNVYVASVEEMESEPVAEQIAASFYGGMPIQIGYCNGRNTTYNGFDNHKGSEINIAITDFMLVLGHNYVSVTILMTCRGDGFFCTEGNGDRDVPDHASPVSSARDGRGI